MIVCGRCRHYHSRSVWRGLCSLWNRIVWGICWCEMGE